jgi:hypothetical protein
MYIIAEKNKKNGFNFINSIFETKAQADKWYAKLLDNQDKKKLDIYKIPIKKYPFYILSNIFKEDNNEFWYAMFLNNLAEVEQELNKIKKTKSNNELYCNLYFIPENSTNPVFPTHPDESCIRGDTDHFHINNAFLNEMKNKGIKSCLYGIEDYI